MSAPLAPPRSILPPGTRQPQLVLESPGCVRTARRSVVDTPGYVPPAGRDREETRQGRSRTCCVRCSRPDGRPPQQRRMLKQADLPTIAMYLSPVQPGDWDTTQRSLQANNYVTSRRCALISKPTVSYELSLLAATRLVRHTFARAPDLRLPSLMPRSPRGHQRDASPRALFLKQSSTCTHPRPSERRVMNPLIAQADFSATPPSRHNLNGRRRRRAPHAPHYDEPHAGFQVRAGAPLSRPVSRAVTFPNSPERTATATSSISGQVTICDALAEILENYACNHDRPHAAELVGNG